MIRYIKFIVLSYASKSNTHQINEFNTQHLNKKYMVKTTFKYMDKTKSK